MSFSQADPTLRILLTLEFRVTCETFTLEISKPFTYKKKLSQSFTEFIDNWFLNHVIPDNLRTLSFHKTFLILVPCWLSLPFMEAPVQKFRQLVFLLWSI